MLDWELKISRCLCVHQETSKINRKNSLAVAFQEQLVNRQAFPVACSSLLDPETVHQLLYNKHLGSLMAIVYEITRVVQLMDLQLDQIET